MQIREVTLDSPHLKARRTNFRKVSRDLSTTARPLIANCNKFS